MQEAVIVDCLRTAVGKAPRGTLRNSRPDDLAAAVIRALLERYPQAKDEVDDVILGCAMPEGEAGSNMARQAALRAGLPAERMQKKYGVSREESDEFALRSHRNAVRAQRAGHFADEIVPVEVETVTPGHVEKTVFQTDEGPRGDTSLEALGKLKPVFQ